MNKKFTALITSSMLSGVVIAQTSITGITTDFGGFYESYANGTNTGINPTTSPDNAHNLLGFQVGSTMYSTGVDDSILTSNSIAFTTGNYGAFIPYLAESTKAGQGASQDGNASQFLGQTYGTPAGDTAFDVTDYVTDGTKGLGLSTFANNVGGVFKFDISQVDGSSVGDGIPDLFYFNMAQPSGGEVNYEFFDGNGNSLGSIKSAENAHPDIANIINDRFDASTGLKTSAASSQYVQGFAVEFSDIPGMTQSKLEQAVRIDVTLPNAADPPFFAYNQDAFVAEAIPPAAVPEPSSTLLLGLGTLVLLLRSRK